MDGKPGHASVSTLQRQALVDLFAKTKLEPEARCLVASQVLAMKWHAQDASLVVNALSSVDDVAVAPKRRRCGQSYQAIGQYLTESDWAVLLEPSSSGAKLQVLLESSFGLGLRTPTEPSIKYLCSLWIYLDVPESQRQRMSPATKFSLFAHVKRELHRRSHGLAACTDHVVALPERPIDFRRLYPLLYEAHFRGVDPVEPQVDLRPVLDLDASYRCRSGGVPQGASSVVPPSQVPTLQLGGSAPLEISAVERVAEMFMTKMEGLQLQQQQMLALVIGNGGGSSSAGRNPQPLPDLEGIPTPRRFDLRRLPTRSASSLAIELRTPAPPAAAESSQPALPTPATPAAAESSQPALALPPQATPAAAESPATLAAAELSEPIKDEVVDIRADGSKLLDAFLERENDKKNAGKILKRPAAVAHPPKVGDGDSDYNE